MNYIDIARQELRRNYPEGAECTPELEDLYLLLVLVKGTAVTPKDVHDAWAVWRSRTRPDHPDLVPFGELTDEVKEWDKPFADAIAESARCGEAEHDAG